MKNAARHFSSLFSEKEKAPSAEAEELARLLATKLREQAEELVDQWIDWVRARVGTRTVHALPVAALENHIPPVIRALASFVETPTHGAHEQMLGHLRLHAIVRRDQGYDINELLAEFDGLAFLVTERARAEFEECGIDVNPAEAVRIFSRLASGLRAIAFVTVGLYQESEQHHQRELARRLDEYGRTISHELRNPIHAASLEAELLAREEVGTDPEKRQRHTGLIRRAMQRATELLDNIDLLAFVESTRSEQPRIRLSTAIESIVDELATMAEKREVSIRVEGDLPAVELEATPLQLALVNLLSNAIKYSDPSKEERWVRIEASLIESEHETAFCEIQVRDNGLGVPEDLETRVFQRYFRAHPEAAEGTGLGLAISRHVLAERGGAIEFETEPGKGSTFRFRLRALDSRQGRRAEEVRAEEVLARAAADGIEPEDDDAAGAADDQVTDARATDESPGDGASGDEETAAAAGGVGGRG